MQSPWPSSEGTQLHLQTDRLVLRAWRDDDLPHFAGLCADPAVMEHFPETLTREGADAAAAQIRYHFERYGYGYWALELSDGQPFIGFVGLQRISFAAPFVAEPPGFTVEIGWRLARAHWGLGLATEAATAALEHAFSWLGLAEVVAYTVADNTRSRNVMQHIGMCYQPAEDFDHPRLPEGHEQRRQVLYRKMNPE